MVCELPEKGVIVDAFIFETLLNFLAPLAAQAGMSDDIFVMRFEDCVAKATTAVIVILIAKMFPDRVKNIALDLRKPLTNNPFSFVGGSEFPRANSFNRQ